MSNCQTIQRAAAALSFPYLLSNKDRLCRDASKRQEKSSPTGGRVTPTKHNQPVKTRLPMRVAAGRYTFSTNRYGGAFNQRKLVRFVSKTWRKRRKPVKTFCWVPKSGTRLLCVSTVHAFNPHKHTATGSKPSPATPTSTSSVPIETGPAIIRNAGNDVPAAK